MTRSFCIFIDMKREQPGVTHRVCKVCLAEKAVEDYYETNKSKCKDCYITYTKNYIKQNKAALIDDEVKFFQQKVKQIKASAKDRNLYFDLTGDYLLELYKKQDRKCAEMLRPFDESDIHRTLSVDRCDSKKGYIEKNVRLVWNGVNRAKGNMEAGEFRDMICTMADNMRRGDL